MNSNNLTLIAEAKEEARIARKRAEMDKRCKRILNPRTRVIGLDVAALDAQVAEKRATGERFVLRENTGNVMLHIRS